MVSGLTAYREYRLSVAGVNYSGNAYNSTEITAWTEEGGTCNILKDVFFCFVVVVVVVFCCCCCCFFLGGGMSRASQVYANKLLVCEEWL